MFERETEHHPRPKLSSTMKRVPLHRGQALIPRRVATVEKQRSHSREGERPRWPSPSVSYRPCTFRSCDCASPSRLPRRRFNRMRMAVFFSGPRSSSWPCANLQLTSAHLPLVKARQRRVFRRSGKVLSSDSWCAKAHSPPYLHLPSRWNSHNLVFCICNLKCVLVSASPSSPSTVSPFLTWFSALLGGARRLAPRLRGSPSGLCEGCAGVGTDPSGGIGVGG